MTYPAKPRLKPLAEFAGTACRRPTPQQRARLLEFVATEYQAGRSIHQLAELTGRTQAVLCTCQGVSPRPPRVAHRALAPGRRRIA